MPNYTRVFVDSCSYFLTVITHQRNPILISNIELLRQSFKTSAVGWISEASSDNFINDHCLVVWHPQTCRS